MAVITLLQLLPTHQQCSQMPFDIWLALHPGIFNQHLKLCLFTQRFKPLINSLVFDARNTDQGLKMSKQAIILFNRLKK